MTWFIFILGAMIAGFVQGLTGFAFALIAMSFWRDDDKVMYVLNLNKSSDGLLF